MGALAHAVRSGKALYAGLSNYDAATTERAAKILRDMGTPCLIHQPKYHMFERGPEKSLFAALVRRGHRRDRLLPARAGDADGPLLETGSRPDLGRRTTRASLKPEAITDGASRIRKLNGIAEARGQSLAQMSLAWVLRQPAVTSALIGASRPSQIEENPRALKNLAFSAEELKAIESALS